MGIRWSKMKLPRNYDELTSKQRRLVREQYVRIQDELCYYCGRNLDGEPPSHITNKRINWDLFPLHFLKYPIHLQHNRATGMTEGAVHAYCNAVMWQYEGR